MLERMQNDEPRQRRRWDPLEGSQVDRALYLAPLSYVIGLVQHDDRLLVMAVAWWAFVYCFSVPFIVRRIARRSPPGDFLRAAAVLAAGALPLSLYIPLWRELTSRTALIVAFPLLLVWCVTAYVMALRSNPPRLTPARRIFVLGGGAMIYGTIALVGFGGAVFTMAMLNGGNPPMGAIVACLLIAAAGLGLGILSGWSALRLWSAKDVPLP
jgi:hypothetical protein